MTRFDASDEERQIHGKLPTLFLSIEHHSYVLVSFLSIEVDALFVLQSRVSFTFSTELIVSGYHKISTTNNLI